MRAAPQSATTTVAASPLIAATVEPSKTIAPTLTATTVAPIRFSGEAAFKHVTAQMSFGPRPADQKRISKPEITSRMN